MNKNDHGEVVLSRSDAINLGSLLRLLATTVLDDHDAYMGLLDKPGTPPSPTRTREITEALAWAQAIAGPDPTSTQS
jgi:hypothetical protein